METKTVHDPFIGKDVQVSCRLVDRLRGKYASGPHLPNGLPEFGWKQFQATPINLEAASHIEKLEAAVRDLLAFRDGDLPTRGWLKDCGASRDVLARLAKLVQ